MPLVHISGLPGAGKSTVTRALRAEGLAAVDVDDGLCVWKHETTGQLRSGHEFPGGRGAEGYDWVVSPAALESLHIAAGDTVVFVAGSVGNREDVADLFLARVALVVDAETLIERLNARPWGAWGHEPEQQSSMLGWRGTFLAEAQAEGAIIIDAGRLTETETVEAVRAAFPAQPVDPAWLDDVWTAACAAAEADLGAELHVDPPSPER